MKRVMFVFAVLVLINLRSQVQALPVPGLSQEHRDLVGQWVYLGGYCKGWTPNQSEKFQSELQDKSYYEQLTINPWHVKFEQRTVKDSGARPVDQCYRSLLYRPMSNIGYVMFDLEEVDEDRKCLVDNQLSLSHHLVVQYRRQRNGNRVVLTVLYYGVDECGEEPFVVKYGNKL